MDSTWPGLNELTMAASCGIIRMPSLIPKKHLLFGSPLYGPTYTRSRVSPRSLLRYVKNLSFMMSSIALRWAASIAPNSLGGTSVSEKNIAACCWNVSMRGGSTSVIRCPAKHSRVAAFFVKYVSRAPLTAAVAGDALSMVLFVAMRPGLPAPDVHPPAIV